MIPERSQASRRVVSRTTTRPSRNTSLTAYIFRVTVGNMNWREGPTRERARTTQTDSYDRIVHSYECLPRNPTLRRGSLTPRPAPTRRERHFVRLVSILTALLACGSLLVVAVAWATETVAIKTSFTPNKLGAATNLSATATFGSTIAGLQSPVTSVTAYGPAGMSVDTRGAGTCTASAAKLKDIGPRACPADSRVGFGKGVGLFELGGELIPAPFTLEFFLAPKENGRLAMLIYVNADTPASEQLVLIATEVHAPKPYGFGITFDIPIIPSLPGAALGWVQHIFLTFGAKNVAYFRSVHGKKTLLHVKGVSVPKMCPRGGFPIEARIGFADGATTTVNPTIPCPAK